MIPGPGPKTAGFQGPLRSPGVAIPATVTPPMATGSPPANPWGATVVMSATPGGPGVTEAMPSRVGQDAGPEAMPVIRLAGVVMSRKFISQGVPPGKAAPVVRQSSSRTTAGGVAPGDHVGSMGVEPSSMVAVNSGLYGRVTQRSIDVEPVLLPLSVSSTCGSFATVTVSSKSTRKNSGKSVSSNEWLGSSIPPPGGAHSMSKSKVGLLATLTVRAICLGLTSVEVTVQAAAIPSTISTPHTRPLLLPPAMAPGSMNVVAPVTSPPVRL